MSNDFNRSLLHEERIKKGLNITELANKLGCSQSMVSKWESGMAKPRSSSIRKLCEFFEVTPEYWEHFYHEPQKPLDSFTPKPPVREEAREAFDKAVNPHEADKDKVRENLEKINNSFETDVKKVRDNLAVVDTIMSEKYKSKNQGDIEISDYEYKRAAFQVISDLKNEIKAKDTEIQGLKCELEGLKVENANLKGQIEGLKFNRPLGEPMKPVVTYASGTGEIEENYETLTGANRSFWKRIFG